MTDAESCALDSAQSIFIGAEANISLRAKSIIVNGQQGTCIVCGDPSKASSIILDQETDMFGSSKNSDRGHREKKENETE